MQCQEARLLIASRRDLNRSQRADLDAHVSRCRACAAARLADDQVSLLLQALPAADLAPPPRVAAALAQQIGRRAGALSLRRGLTMALSLGAALCLAALLLNAASAGALLRLALGEPALLDPVDTAAAPPAAAPPDRLYLARQTGESSLQLDAYDPAAPRPHFSIPIRPAGAQTLQADGGLQVTMQAADVLLSPDGGRLYALEHAEGGYALAAYAASDGGQLWRTALPGVAPAVRLEDRPSLLLSPDGARLYVRSFVAAAGSPQSPGSLVILGGDQPTLRLHAIDPARGALLGDSLDLLVPARAAVALADGQLAFTDGAQVFGVSFSADGSASPTTWIVTGEAVAERVDFPADRLLPALDGHMVYAVSEDLQVAEISFELGVPRLGRVVDLVERGQFFFDQIAISADGETLAVAQTREDERSGGLQAELRFYRTGAWAELGRATVDQKVEALALSADGATAYLALGATRLFIVAEGDTLPTPAPAPPQPRASRLVAVDAGEGTARDLAGYEGWALLLLAGAR